MHGKFYTQPKQGLYIPDFPKVGQLAGRLRFDKCTNMRPLSDGETKRSRLLKIKGIVKGTVMRDYDVLPGGGTVRKTGGGTKE